MGTYSLGRPTMFPLAVNFTGHCPFLLGPPDTPLVTGLLWMMQISCLSKFIFVPFGLPGITDSDPLYPSRD